MIRCNKEYRRLVLSPLKTFADGVVTGYFGNNPPFTVLPLTLIAFQALIDDYETKRSAYESGGEDQKGPYLIAKDALIDALDLLSPETDKVADGDAAVIILAGFVPTKERGETNKPGQGIVTVKRGIAGELIATCAIIDEAKHYLCIMTEGAPLPEEIVINGNGRIVVAMNEPGPSPGPGPTPPPLSVASFQMDFTGQRTKHFQNLTHDVTYYFYFFAVNAKGVGPLSEVVSMVCW